MKAIYKDNADTIIGNMDAQLRGVRPFLSDKYDYTNDNFQKFYTSNH